MFRTSGAIDDRSFKAICFQTLPDSYFITIGAFSIFTIVMIVAAIISRDTQNILFLLGGLALFWFLIVARYHTYKNKVVDKMKSTGHSEIKFTSFFDEDKVNLINDSNGARSSVGYHVFVKYAESDQLILLLTRHSQFVPIFKDKLKPGDREALIEFLKKKCIKVKRWGKA